MFAYLVLLMIRRLKESIELKVVFMSCPASVSYSIYLKAIQLEPNKGL